MNLSRTRLFVVNFLTLVLVSFLYTFSLQAQWTNGQDAAYVLGQSIFTTSVAGTTQQQMSGPGGIAIDATNNKLYVVDVNNNRVLRFGLPITSNNPSAEIVFGQPNFTSSGTGTTQNTFNDPRAAAVDAAGNLYIVELNNNRILRFNAAHAIAVNQPNANWVYGQPNFTSSAAATTQTGLSSPFAIAISSVTGDVFVADRQNRRIVRYPAASLTSNGPNANLVLGAANYTTVGSAVPAQNSTPFPNGVTVIGNTLYVSDNNAVRVVAFDNIGSKVNGDNADRVLGQPNFTASATALTATGMGSPTRMATDGTNLFVGDGNVGANNRVLIFNNANAKVNGAAADNVLGQPNFTTSGINLTQRGMNSATGLAFVGSVLFVADISQNRVLIFAQSGMNVAGNVAPYNPRPTTTPLMNTMNYGTPTGSPVKVPMNTAGVNSIDVTFSQPLAPWVFSNGTTSPNARDAMKVFGTTSRGYRSGIGFAGSGATLQFTTTASVATSFNPGENVWVTVTNAQSTGFAPTRPFVMGFRTAAGTGPVNFTSQPTGSPFATGNSPQGMALADFDGDGDLDMATANYTANTASILVNNGSGTYTPHPVAPTPAAGTSPYLLIAGDVDNDGDIDLAVANDGSGVTIMFNNGSGNFSTTTLVAGGDPTGLALADIDADGDLDLMTTNFTGNTVTTRLNNGSGGFGAATPYTTGGGPGAVGMGDIDNDGDLDMVVSANTGNRIDVFMNRGYGTFYQTAVPNYATGTGPRSVNFADLNNDGFMDVVTVSGTSNNANVFLNNTAGGFAAAVNYATGTTPFPVRLGDVDGDGDLDMVVANNGSDDVTVRLNNGAGNFTTLASGSPFAAGGGSAPWGMELGDVDGDGDVDIAMTKQTGNLAVVLLNAGPMNVTNNAPPFGIPPVTPTFNTMIASPITAISIPFNANLNAGTVNATNFRVHGMMRGLRTATYGVAANTATLTGITSSFLPNEQIFVSVTNAQSTAGSNTRPFVMGFRTRVTAGQGQFPTQMSGSPVIVPTPNVVKFAELNGLAGTDVVSANGSSNNISILVNNGSGGYSNAVGSPRATTSSADDIAVGDVDNDGDMDVVVASVGVASTQVLYNNGSGNFATSSTFGGNLCVATELGDVDGDGDLDIVSKVNGAPNRIEVLLNNGSGSFTVAPGSPFSVGGTSGFNLALGDIDNDGDLDAVVINLGSNDACLMLNSGYGTFYNGGLVAVGNGPQEVVLADVNSDQRLDILTANYGANTASVLLNGGSLSFANAAGSPFAVVSMPRGLEVGDIDNDGDLDLAVTSQAGGGNTSVLLNDGAGGFGTSAPGSPYSAGGQAFRASFGDADGDGDVDLAVVINSPNRIVVLNNTLLLNVLGNVPPFTPRPTTTPLMNTMNYGTPTGSPVKVPMNTAGVNSIDITFSQNLAPWVFSNGTTSPTARDAMKVHGTTSRGYRSGVGFAGSGATLQFTTTASITSSFNPGEQVWVTVTNAQSTAGASTRPFVMGFRTRAGSGPAQFPAQTTLAAGTQPYSVATGDFDSDGDLDFVAAALGTSNIYVYLNTGTGTFAAPVTYTGAASMYSVGVADLNNDGALDIAAGSVGMGTYVFLNQNLGTGTFSPAVFYTQSTGVSSYAFGDMDADGDLDMVFTLPNLNSIGIRFNNGAGVFGASTGYFIGASTGPNSVIVADLDGDGDLDVAEANQINANVSVLMNNGAGTLGTVANNPTPGTPWGLAAGDIDGDGDIDLVSTNPGVNSVSVFVNSGTGTFSRTDYTTGFNQPRGVTFDDVDGDGDLDIAVSNSNAVGTVSILLNTLGTFSAGISYASGAAPYGIASGDVDGDGDIDLITPNYNAANVSVLLNTLPMNVAGNVPPFTPRPTTTPLMNTMNVGTPSGSPVKVPMNTVPTGISATFSQNATAATFTDPTARNVMKVHGTTSQGYRSGTGFSGAGATMTFTTTANFNPGEQVWVSVTNAQSTGGAFTRPFVMGFRTAAGAGSATFYPATTLPKIDNNGFTSCEVGDLDGDGDLDIVSTNTAGLAVHLQTGVNTGVFSLSTAFGWGAGSGAQARNIKLADVNNDGNLDAVAVNAVAPCALVVWVGNGAGGFGAAASYTFAGGSNTGSLSLADVDADGDLDAISGDFAANSLHVMLNNGSGAFTTAPGSPFAAGATLMTNTAVGDVDNDGDIDVCMVSATRLFVMLNNGVGRFASATGSPFAIGASNSMIALGDINGDGFLDAVFGDGATVHARLNNGSGTAWTASTGSPYAVGINARSLLADVDGNGRLDIVALGQAGSTPTHVLLNGGGLSPNFTPVVGSPFAREAGNIAAAAVPCTVGDMDGDGDLDIIYVTDTPANVTILKNGTQPLVSSVAPFRNGNTTMNNPNIAGVGAPVTVNFSTNITTNTYSVPPAQQLFTVHGGFTGSRTRAQGFSPNGAYSGGAATMTFTPSATFRVGELVSVSVTNASSSVAAPNNSVGIRTRPFVFNYRVAAGAGPATFQQVSAPAAGTNPESITSADFDGDGDLDVAIANFGSANTSILLNTGAGAFAAAVNYGVGSQPYSVTSGDFDNDGDLDVATANNGANNVSVLLNTGAGAFAAAVNYGVGSQPRAITSGDFDGDGDFDLAVANLNGNTISILLNNGNGTFAPAVNYGAGSQPRAITTGDFDGDGDFDLAVPNFLGNNVDIFLNTGSGTFGLAASYAVGTAPAAITNGDFDGDGDLDLAVANANSNNTSILLNSGSGAFAAAVNYAVGAGPRGISSGDFDGDGDIDLSVANFTSNDISVLLNTGTGIYGTAVQYAVGTGPRSLTSGDFDGDGDLDIAASNFTSNNASILFNMPPPTTFYYQSGDAGVPANWNSLPWGGGFAAPSFNAPAQNFIVMGGGATTTATVNTSFTLGANVSLHVTTPSVLAVNNGITITNNGFLNVSGATVAGATLRLSGTAAIAGNAVTYWGTTATLEYGGAAARATSAIEFPAAMPGSVTINNTGGVTLHANRQINGTLTMQSGTLNIAGRTLQPNGAIIFSGGTIIASATAALTITGAGNITGSALFTGALGALTMNRAAATLVLGSPLDISGTLTLTQGFVQTTPTNILRLTNTAAGAIVTSGTTSHVAGPLRWFLPAGGGAYTFPVGGGTAATYIPLSVTYASAGGTASYEVQPFLTGSGGTETGVIGAGTLSSTEYWRTVLGGFALNNATLTFTRTTPALIGTSRIGEAATAGGVYQGINTNMLSTVAAPTISNTTLFAPLNPGTMFYAIGAAAAAPTVTAISPARNNPAATPLTSNIAITFSQTLTNLNMRTWNGFTGLNTVLPTAAVNIATQTGMNTRPGERVMTTVVGLPFATPTASASGGMTASHVTSFIGRAGAAPATFTEVGLTAQPNIWGMQVGYFNNDTNLDVALSTGASPTGALRIFTGDGAGNFTLWYNALLSGGTPQGRGLAVGDFNNDGRADVAVSNILTGTVDIFTNNAGTTMTVGVTLPAFSAFDVTVADFDGDGNLDVAAAGFGGGQLFVYRGDGTGGFIAAPSSPYAIGAGGASGIRAEDINNDGAMDILLHTGTTIRAFTNNGAGLFSQTNIPTGYTAILGLFTADMDNDGDVDIVPIGFAPTISIYQNNGAGVFAAVAIPATPAVAANIGDFNGDGLMDIITNNNPADVPYFVQNANTVAGTLAFAAPRVMPNPTLTGGSGAVGDVDGDGDLDILGGGGGTSFRFLRNAPFQNVVNNTFPFGIPPVTPTYNSINAPSATTIVVPFAQNVTGATASANVFKVWGGFTGLRSMSSYVTGAANATLTPSLPFRPGEQVFVSVTHAQSSVNVPTRPFVMGFRARAGVGPATFQQVTIPTMLTGPRSIATGDFDGNGALDFAATNGSSNNVTILISTGGGTYSASTVTVGASPQCVMPGDFDNDGDLDLAVADGASNVSLLRNTAGVFAAWGPVLVVGALPQAIAVGDYDADGDLDLATVNLTGNNVSILLNTGAGSFAGAVNYALSGGSNPEFITTGDFDNDGDLDLATANYGTNTVSILMNSGFGTFALTGNFPVGTQPQFITAADLNGDGYLDLATANAGGGGINDISILVNSNVTPGTFAAVNYAVGAGTVAVMPGDFDGDGDLDLTVANGGNVSMMRNTGGVFALATNNVLGGQPFSLATGDFDNDGDIDAATVNFGPDNVAILFNQNSPTRAGFGNALTFNGTTQDVAATNPAFDISAGTLETWIRPTWVSGAPPANPCIMAIRDGIGNTRYSFHIMSNYSGLAIWNGSLAFFPYPFAQNQWYHIAVTLTGGAATLYVNGIQAGAPIPYGVGPATGGQVHIGWAPVSGEPWQGDIDEVRLWNTALPPTTINTYKGVEISASHPNWANLLGYWRFNEYGGATAADASGNGNTGTLVNAPTHSISLAPVSMIADPAFGVPTSVALPATVAVGLPTITQVALPAPTFGSVAPPAGNPVNYTPFIGIPPGAVDNFIYQASDGITSSQATVSVRYRPQLTGNSFAVAGLPTVLTAPILNGGTSPFTWSWTPATPELSSTSIQFPTFTGLTPQSYTVQVTDALGFTASAPVNVTIVPGAFYYTNGDAALPSQWRSFYGNGSPAPSFTIPGTTFIVMGSAVFGATTATTVNNMVIGTGVTVRIQAPSVLTIADGMTLTNFGTLIVEGNSSTGGTLRLLGTGSIVGNAPIYAGSMSVLQYSGTNVQRSSSPVEFPSLPNVMPATVVVDENVTVVLDDHKTLSSALVLGGLVDIRGRNVILQGRLDLRGAFISDGQSDLEIGTGGGTPAGITGALKIATNVMRNVTLNRPGSSVLLGSPLLIQGGLSLARGILRSDTTNHPIMVNTSSSAIVGGNDSSFVDGPVRRYFPTNILTGGAGSWLFPTGRGSRYLPFTLVDPRTGGDAPLLQVEALTGAPGGTLDGTLSSAGQGEYWNVRLVAGNHTQSRAELGRYGAFAQAIPPGSVVAKSPTQSGVYTNIGGAVAGFAIQSGTFATFSTFTIGSPFSTIPASQQPTITGFGPAVGTSATSVLVEGTNLGALSSVLVGGVPVSFTVVSPTQITLVLNPGVQSGPITLTTSTSGSATSFQPLTFIGPPTMATVSPQYFGVGQDIIINGNNFYGTPTLGELYLPVVRIGGITASNVEIISPTQLRVRFPVATTGNLTVQSWGGIATTASVVGVLPTPRVVSLSPSTAGAGETVTLTGTDFRLIGSVSIGGVPVTEYVVTSSTGITLRVPPGATTGTIRILGAGGSTTSTQQLTIIPPPVITSFTPGSGSAGQIVTLTGTNFTDATSVRFGNTTATFTVSADGRTIQAIIPAGVVTGATMSVTTRGGTATSGTGFLGTLPPDPTITGFEPVPVVEGGLLTVRGVNFPYNPNNPLANVILGGVAVPGAFYTSSTTLVFRVPQGVVPVTMLSTQAIITLQTPRGATSASLQVPIRAADAPVITGFSPEEGDSVTMITIEGRNFGSSPRTTILDITIGGVPVQSFVVVNSRVIVSVAGAVTSGAIVIRTPSGTVTTTGTFRYTGTPVGGVARQDSLALLRLYTDLGGPGWTDRTNWGRGFVDSWYGVTVENGRVTELTLGNNNVRGALSTPSVDSALAQLSGLRVLDVSNNGLTGTVPRSIGKLTLLETLNLSKNKLTGGLKDLCGLVRLRDLDVSNNALRDSLSGVLCCLTNLERANVSNNRIYGAVPLCLLELERLSFLDASGNELSDSLPPELVGMRSLTVLNLRRNRLVGTLPAAWGNGQAKTTVSKGAAVTTLAGLQTLDLGANGITGMIPESWSALTGLRVLALDSNRLTGAVPAGFAQLGRLQTLSLGRNSLSDIPDLRGIARLSVVGLADNAFEFGPLEGHRARVGQVGTTFTYIPQAEVGVAREMAVPPDAPWDVTIEVSGTNNRYEWQKRQADGSWKTAFAASANSMGASSTSASVRFATFAVADAGVYRCAITNSYLPGLVLLSRPQTVRPVALTNAPAVPILVEPETNETTALRPVFVWTTSIGAAGYELQVATEATFRVLANVQRVGQTLEAVETGVVEAVSTLKLERSTRYYWRVLSQNSFGSSMWSTAGTFTTADKDIAFTARIVEFGRVPRLDTGVAVLRVRNVADGAATLVSAVAEQVGASSVFRVDASASVVGGVRFAVGEVREYPVAFVPSAVRRYDAGVAFAYSVNGQRDTWTQAQRLRGVGSALKLLAPSLDTILIGLPRVSAALLINRGDVEMMVTQTRLLANGRGAFALKGATTFSLGAGDTTAVLVRCAASAPGALPRVVVEAAGYGEIKTASTTATFVDTARVEIRSFARRRVPTDLVALIGARAKAVTALPPGTTLPIELYLNTEVSTGRDTLQRLASPLVSGSVRYGNQVMTLSAGERSWRRARNTSAGNRLERAVMPETALNRSNSAILAQFQGQIVAGDTDTTTVEIEDVRWSGVYLIEYETSGTVRARVSEAGGKRLIGSVVAGATPTIVAIAPNPAREEVEVRYTLPTEGVVRLVLMDARGTEVLVLVGGERQQAGEYSVRRAVVAMASGNYTLRLTLGGSTARQNMTIVR